MPRIEQSEDDADIGQRLVRQAGEIVGDADARSAPTARSGTGPAAAGRSCRFPRSCRRPSAMRGCTGRRRVCRYCHRPKRMPRAQTTMPEYRMASPVTSRRREAERSPRADRAIWIWDSPPWRRLRRPPGGRRGQPRRMGDFIVPTGGNEDVRSRKPADRGWTSPRAPRQRGGRLEGRDGGIRKQRKVRPSATAGRRARDAPPAGSGRADSADCRTVTRGPPRESPRRP